MSERCAWETILFAFAIGVSEIFLMIALGGLTIALFGFWMLMDVRLPIFMIYLDADFGRRM